MYVCVCVYACVHLFLSCVSVSISLLSIRVCARACGVRVYTDRLNVCVSIQIPPALQDLLQQHPIFVDGLCVLCMRVWMASSNGHASDLEVGFNDELDARLQLILPELVHEHCGGHHRAGPGLMEEVAVKAIGGGVHGGGI